MPWRVQTPVTARREFVADHQRGLYSMAELCIQYAISRPTGYQWAARYAAAALAGLADQRRIAAHCPHRTPARIATALLEARRAHPIWGPALTNGCALPCSVSARVNALNRPVSEQVRWGRSAPR